MALSRLQHEGLVFWRLLMPDPVSLRNRGRSTLPPCRQVTSSISGDASATSHIDRMSGQLCHLGRDAGEQLFWSFPTGMAAREGDPYTFVSDTNRVITSALAGQCRKRIADRMPLCCPRDRSCQVFTIRRLGIAVSD